MKLASFQVQTPVGRFTRIGSVQGTSQLILQAINDQPSAFSLGG